MAFRNQRISPDLLPSCLDLPVEQRPARVVDAVHDGFTGGQEIRRTLDGFQKPKDFS